MASGLELDSIAPPRRFDGNVAPTSKVRETDELTLRDIADFAPPPSGVLGALQYWWHVYLRQRELTAELRQAEKIGKTTQAERRALLAELGRKARELGIGGEAIGSLISKAAIAEGELKGTERKHVNLASEHQVRLEPLEAEIQLIKAETEPLREQEESLKDEQKKLLTDRRRIEARLRRAEIELRNIEELIAKRQEAYANLSQPKEDRERLLKEIALFDNKRPAILEQVQTGEEELAVRAKPIAEVETRLGEIRGELSDKLQKINELTNEITRIARGFAAREDEIAGQVKREAEAAESSWAAVGERVLKEQRKEEGLQDIASHAESAVVEATAAERKIELLGAAHSAYDHGVVSRAKRTAVAALITACFLIAIWLYFK